MIWMASCLACSRWRKLLREQPVQAETVATCAKLANRPSGGIMFATIQKFMPGEDEDTFPMLSDRRNIVVIADEAHRTQYGFGATLKSKPAPPNMAQEAPAHYQIRDLPDNETRRESRRQYDRYGKRRRQSIVTWWNLDQSSIRWAMRNTCATPCPMPRLLPSPARRYQAKTATPARCSAITSTFTTCRGA